VIALTTFFSNSSVATRLESAFDKATLRRMAEEHDWDTEPRRALEQAVPFDDPFEREMTMEPAVVYFFDGPQSLN
jgi:hypothetical protein